MESSAIAQAETAAESLRRDEALLGDGIIPQSRLSQTRLQHSQAVAQLAEKRQSPRLAGLRGSWTFSVVQEVDRDDDGKDWKTRIGDRIALHRDQGSG